LKNVACVDVTDKMCHGWQQLCINF